MKKRIKHANDRIRDGFRAAFSGLRETIMFERSFRMMLGIAGGVAFLTFYFPTSPLEKVALAAAIFSVLILELINSTIERILDFISPEYDERVRIIKDLMAAIVLLASIASAIVGVIILGPYLFELYKKTAS
jgi:diacylglycerol kinase